MIEIELKLAADEAAMERLLAADLIKDAAQGPMRATDLHAVYYDTGDRRLGRRQLALRVRQAGDRFVQTLKGPGAGNGGHAARSEWEVERHDLTPDLRAFQDDDALECTGLVLPDELQSVFETRIHRRVVTVAWGDGGGGPALIEVAFDQGSLHARSRHAPVAEIELELKSGEITAAYDLALALRQRVPLRVEPLDKAARGWMLASGLPPAWHKAGEVALAPSMSVEQGFAAIVDACLGHWLRNEASARIGREPEGLHQLRVALRRLRSAFSLFAPALPAAALLHWQGELRWLVGSIGVARDLDVLATETLPPVLAARPDDAGLRALAAHVAREREAARQAVATVIEGQRYADLVLELAAWTARRGWADAADVDLRLRQRAPLPGLAASLLAKRYRQVRKRGRKLAGLPPDERHRLRIALKKLRYGVEFFAGLYPGRSTKQFRRASAGLQETLGRFNDAAVAAHLVGRLGDRLPAGEATQVAQGGGQVIGWQAARGVAAEPELLRDWAAFKRRRPFWDRSEEHPDP